MIITVELHVQFCMVTAYKHTYVIEQNPSWEANNHSACQEITQLFIEPEGSLLCAPGPITTNSVHILTYIFVRFI
jgi:hypothetical protein